MSSFPCLAPRCPGAGEARYSLGHRLVDRSSPGPWPLAGPHFGRDIRFMTSEERIAQRVAGNGNEPVMGVTLRRSIVDGVH